MIVLLCDTGGSHQAVVHQLHHSHFTATMDLVSLPEDTHFEILEHLIVDEILQLRLVCQINTNALNSRKILIIQVLLDMQDVLRIYKQAYCLALHQQATSRSAALSSHSVSPTVHDGK